MNEEHPKESSGVENGLLAGQTVLVAGGTGSVGRRLVDALLGGGATVVVPSRSRERLAELERAVGAADSGDRLLTLKGDVGDEEDAVRLGEEALERTGRLDGVVASLGRFSPASSVLAAPRGDLASVLEDYLLAHFVAAGALIPLLEEGGGSYTFIQGPLAFDPASPAASLVSIATAGQAMLARTVMQETRGGPVRVNEVVLYTGFGWGSNEKKELSPVTQDDVGRYVALLTSDRGSAVRGETIHLDSLEPLEALR